MESTRSIAIALVMILVVVVGLTSISEAKSLNNSSSVAQLRSCLANSGIEVDTTLFERDADADPDSVYAHHNYQWEQITPTVYPAAYFLPRSTSDIQTIVLCAKPIGAQLVPKGGGHSYEKYSYGDGDSVVIDMQRLDSLQVDAVRKKFTVGAGALLSQIAWPLYSRHNLVTAHGTCPTVGIAGLALGGGYGYLSRLHGLTTDNVIELELVDANGNLLRVNKDVNNDLYWALKGAGSGSYGIITSLTIKAYDPPKQIVFGYAYYPLGVFTLAFAAWQRFLYTFYPREINTKFIVSGNRVIVEVFEVQEVVPDGDPLERVRAFIAQFPYTVDTRFEVYNYTDFLMKTMHAAAYGVTDPSQFEGLTRHSQSEKYFKAKSFFGSRQASESEFSTLLNVLERIPSPDETIIELYALGGQINDPEAYSTSSFMHRSQALYLAQIFYEARGRPTVVEVEASRHWLREFYQVSSSILGGGYSYQNYADGDLDDYLGKYYGWHLARLMQIKRNVDPENYFRHPQSIPVGVAEE